MIQATAVSKKYTVLKPNAKYSGILHPIRKRDTIEFCALHPISVSIAPGELVGVLGASGAGKTTLLSLLSGNAQPTTGTVNGFGTDTVQNSDNYKKQVAVLSATQAPADGLFDSSPLTTFRAVQSTFAIPENDFKLRLATLAKQMDVVMTLQKDMSELRTSERMRCEWIAALLPAPKVVFLDEYLSGADAVTTQAIFESMQILQKTGTAFVLASQQPEEIFAYTGRILFLANGTLLFDGSKKQLQTQIGTKKIVMLTLTAPMQMYGIPHAKLLAQPSPLVLILEVDTVKQSIGTWISQVMKRMQCADFSVRDFSLREIQEKLSE